MERSSNLGHSPMITLSMRNAPTGIDPSHLRFKRAYECLPGKGKTKKGAIMLRTVGILAALYRPSRQWSASPRRAPLRLRQWPPLNDLIYNVRGAVINYVLGDLLRHLGEPPPKALRS